MKTRQSGVFRFIVIFVLFFALLRFFPLVIRAAQVVALGMRYYWWAILPALAMVWAIQKPRQSKDPVDAARDVTDTAR